MHSIKISIAISVILASFSASAKSSLSEYCAVQASQYRYYAHGYTVGAKWVPGSNVAPKYGDGIINAEGVIIDYYIAQNYVEGAAQLTKEVTRKLIHTAYENHFSGRSEVFGSYWVMANCLNLIDKPATLLGRCDRRDAEPSKDGFMMFVHCSNQ